MNDQLEDPSRRSRYGTVVVALAIAVLLTGGGAQAGEPLRQKYELPFRGRPLPQLLQPSATISCTSESAASTGYYLKNLADDPSKGFSLVSALEKQSQPQVWRISIQGGKAVEEVESQEYQVIRQGDSGVILVGVERVPMGTHVEVITIDARNGSFLATKSGVSALSNRTNVYYGRCQ